MSSSGKGGGRPRKGALEFRGRPRRPKPSAVFEAS